MFFIRLIKISDVKKVVVPIIFVSFLGCGQIADGENLSKRGEFDKGVYTNEFFEFTLDVPESWNVISGKQTQKLEAALFQDLANSEEERQVFYLLFSLNKTEFQGTFISGYAVDLESLRGTENASDYLREERKALSGSRKIEVGTVVTGQLGGREFKALSINVEGARRIKYATDKDEYVLVLSIDYGTHEAFAEAKRILDNVRIE